MKVKLIKEEIIDLSLEDIRTQSRKDQQQEPFIHNGKKYAMVSWKTIPTFIKELQEAEVRLVEIKN